MGDSPSTFLAAQHKLAHDLILKTKQIEYIISVLPGVENSREKQEERIRNLERELKKVLRERAILSKAKMVSSSCMM